MAYCPGYRRLLSYVIGLGVIFFIIINMRMQHKTPLIKSNLNQRDVINDDYTALENANKFALAVDLEQGECLYCNNLQCWKHN